MSLYHKENPAYFERCMRSIWEEQSVQPNEIVLVLDGPLPEKLLQVIDVWQQKLGNRFKQIPLKQNVGLGEALNRGLHACSHNLVARMDTDDIAMPDRFKVQLKILTDEHIDACGSWINEFDEDETIVQSIRRVPQYHDEIVVFAKKRNPINHVTIMFRKKAVLHAGGYLPMLWFEDYYLWSRMIQTGAHFYNIQASLVSVRSGEAQIGRRQGITYIKQEFAFQRELYRIGFISASQLLFNLAVRTGVRVLPRRAVASLYQTIRNLK